MNAVAAVTPRRRGRPSHDALAASTPTGRALVWIQDRVADAALGYLRFCDAHERESLLDTECDGVIDHAIRELDAGRPLEARALLLYFRERDALRDAEHHAQPRHVGLARTAVRRIGAMAERSLTALRRKP